MGRELQTKKQEAWGLTETQKTNMFERKLLREEGRGVMLRPGAEPKQRDIQERGRKGTATLVPSIQHLASKPIILVLGVGTFRGTIWGGNIQRYYKRIVRFKLSSSA